MAEASLLPERVQESLHCPVCFHCYEDPRNLPCQHTFCKNCIKKMILKSSLTCPLCNTEHLILATEPDDFPKNYALCNVLDCLCEECKQRQKANICNFCEKGICEVCNMTHDQEHSTDARKTLEVLQFQLTELERRNICKKEETARRADKVKAEIQSSFQACRDALDDRERKLIDHLHMIVHQEVDSSSQNEFRQQMNGASEFCTAAMATVLANERVDALAMCDLKEIKDKAREHSNLILPIAEENTGNPPRIFFTYSSQDVQKPLGSFGRLMTAQEESDICKPTINRPLSMDYFPYLAPKYILGRYVKCEAEADEFGRPWGVACSPIDGYTVITDVENHKVYVFTDADLMFSFGAKGRGNEQFYQPRGVAISYDENIYIADSYNNRIQVFDAKGKYIRTIGRKGSSSGHFNQPMGMAFDTSCGLLYVCDSNNYRIQAIQEDGSAVRVFGSRGSGSHQFSNIPCHIALSPEGKVYVSDRTEFVHIFSQEGDFIDVVDIRKVINVGQCNLAGLSVDPAGNIIVVTEQGDVIVLWDDELKAQYIRKVTEENSTCLKDVAFNNDGVMLICDCESRTVKAFDTILHF